VSGARRRDGPGVAPETAAGAAGGTDAPAATADAPAETIVHASAVALSGRALLITGPSGSGKSTLALGLLALGAGLVADDRTRLTRDGGGPVIASAPAPIAGLIEVRGLGLLRVAPAPPAPVAVVVDLGIDETERLPPERATVVLGRRLRLLHRPPTPNLAAALYLLLTGPEPT
jgi:HPr kinase/phosphorylase